ncbi:hypothetical protein BP6252_13186 [Coleophoma cylindrospora]|uniref:Amidase domain-containing protein n=1 Tax=Coleophoma cylindrospora TaxID=1849047 RepID=A0A3D8QAP1_9HELO|nr:hypothetical protein BP6252_13186 [Coleophoma cylindrospora]
MPPSWQALARAKRQTITNQIPPSWRIDEPPYSESSSSAADRPTAPTDTEHQQQNITGTYPHQFLTPREIEITENDVLDSLNLIHSGHWTCVEVTRAFCHRASLAHQLTNCLHELCLEQAIMDATHLDSYFEQHGTPIGPLHGMLVSLADCYHVKGMQTSLGYVEWIGAVEGAEAGLQSEVVKGLKELGAICFCKTAVPQALLGIQCTNNIVGRVLNPFNRRLSSGGSSGGEGALVSQHGSMVGMGSDRGGGVRITSSYNGLYGLRPSTGRISHQGVRTSMDGQDTILPVVGPIARSISTLRLIMQSLLGAQPWLHDPLVLELPWRTQQEAEILSIINSPAHDPSSIKQLCFGMLRTDGLSVPQPPVQRALRMAASALIKKGHRIIEWDPPTHVQAYQVALTTFLSDGGKDVHKTLATSGEPMTESVRLLYGAAPVAETTSSSIMATNKQKRDFQVAYLKYWMSTSAVSGTGRPVDAIISPVSTSPATRTTGNLVDGHCIWVDVLDYTSVVIPVTSVDKDLDALDMATQGGNPLDREVREDFDIGIYEGLPVGLQVVGQRLQEEKALALAELLVHALETL